MKPDGRNVKAYVKGIYNEKEEEIKSAPHPKQTLFLVLEEEASLYDILRRKEDRGEKNHETADCGCSLL